MPTPKERNALIFLAALGALGIGARAFRGTAPPGNAPGPAALERQIGAVDSATLARRSATARRPTGRRAPAPGDRAASRNAAPRDSSVRQRAQSPREGARPAGRAAARAPAPTEDTAASNPLAKYEARRQEVERLNKALQARIDRDRTAARAGTDSAPPRRSAPRKKPVKIRSVPQRPFHP